MACGLRPYFGGLKNNSETKGVQFRAFVFYEQFVQIIVEEEVDRAYSNLCAESVAHVVDVKVIFVFIFFFVAIFFINQLVGAVDAVTNVRTHTNSKTTAM